MTEPPTDGGERTISWRELLAETTALVGDPMHARWICQTATSTDAEEFRSLLDEPAGERAVGHLDAMVARARAGEPVQYVLGSWSFRHVDLAVDARALIPRPETEQVAGIAIELAARVSPTRRVLELGTGTGAIGLAVADELPIAGTSVWITDVSPDALELARSNIAGLGRSAVNVRATEGSWYEALPAGERFDVIVSNPPYVAVGSPDIDDAVTEWEPGAALFSGPDGLDDLRLVVAGAPSHLTAGGWLVVEHGHDQGAVVRALFVEAGFDESSVETRRDAAGHDRATLGRIPG